jgi:hypothetical protein
MPHNKIKNAFLSAVNSVIANPDQFAVNPEKDFTRQRKITPDTLISFLVSKGSSSARVEMLDFWGLDQQMPSLPALNQQRAKLKHEALEAVLVGFNDSVSSQAGFPVSDDGYRYLAADGSTTTFFSSPKLAPKSISARPATPQTASTASISMLFLTLMHTSIRTPSSSPCMKKTSLAHSATLWTGTGRSPAGRMSTLATGATAPTTTWHMWRNRGSIFSSAQRISIPKAWSEISISQKRNLLILT